MLGFLIKAPCRIYLKVHAYLNFRNFKNKPVQMLILCQKVEPCIQLTHVLCIIYLFNRTKLWLCRFHQVILESISNSSLYEVLEFYVFYLLFLSLIEYNPKYFRLKNILLECGIKLYTFNSSQ
jgi:hypothetical protein